MATTHISMSSINFSQNNQCIDPSDLDSWVDFNAVQSPMNNGSNSTPISLSRQESEIASPTNSLLPLDQADEQMTPVQPAHEYQRWKQQTGIPIGSLASLTSMGESSSMGFQPSMSFNYGLDDYTLSGGSMYDGMGSSGMDMEMTPASALPAFFFPGDASSQADNFIDPSSITALEEPQTNIRFYPGMHQQQAARAQAQAQAQAERERQMAQQQQQQKQKQRAAEQQARSLPARRTASHQPLDAHTEETIQRVVNQIRQNSSFGSEDGDHSGSNLPHIIRSKKDEEDMDEDERLLASEEGKKLSSKERRQLRNKVSARAFRSRRKEYIGQLEGELATKANEANELSIQNRQLMEENARSRAFIEKLLRHPAFHPFLDDLSRDPALNKSVADLAAPTPASAPKEDDSFASSAHQFPPKIENNTTHVGMTMIPETPLDMSMLNLGGSSSWGSVPFGYQQPQIFAVLELPEGPAAPLDLEALSGKGSDSTSSFIEEQESKPQYPALEQYTIERKAEITEVASVIPADIDVNDPSFALYIDTPAKSPVVAAPESRNSFFGNIAPEKVFGQFQVVVSNDCNEAESSRMIERLARLTSRMDVSSDRIGRLTSHLSV